ncbi:MAG TPA: EamA family transporter RarD [Bacteriovoracaceae bacterium]|nr:EamA family transporter RarD [Bacteriovoracaceae bacterium]
MKLSTAHLSAILAFSLWGLFPLYWKLFPEVSAWDLFGHRLVWSFLTLFLILFFRRRLSSIGLIWREPKKRNMLLLSAVLISSNWLLYIYAVSTGQVLEASMGYFLNPLINVFMGWILLKEKIRSSQWPAIVLAVFAIVWMVAQSDLSQFPWIALTLSVTFALYGLIRKVTQVGSLEGLAFETCAVILPVLLFWNFQETTPLTIYTAVPGWKILALALSGIVTCSPLILFAYSAKRLQLQTLGFIQYLSPSFKFLCGLLVLHEPLSPERLHAFFLIWTALLWYTLESFFFLRKGQKAVPVTE